jgi:hypothetical protein
MSGSLFYWDRGRPARCEREARAGFRGGKFLQEVAADGAPCGRDARGPSEEVEPS